MLPQCAILLAFQNTAPLAAERFDFDIQRELILISGDPRFPVVKQVPALYAILLLELRTEELAAVFITLIDSPTKSRVECARQAAERSQAVLPQSSDDCARGWDIRVMMGAMKLAAIVLCGLLVAVCSSIGKRLIV